MANGLALSSGPLPGSSHLVSDQRLTRLARDGDRRAFSAIYQRYHQDLYRYCQAILGDPQEAQDALQATMVKVLAALPGEKREIRLRPWLYRIAHNEAIEVVRRRRPTDPIADDAAPAAPGPEEVAERRDTLRGLIDDLGELPERQRGAVVMRELGGLSFEQIGSAFGTSAAVARQTVYEARVNLEQMSRGREMACAEMRRRISDGDGRVMRRRDVRAHLRACRECRDFRSAIATRKRDLAALAPLPAAGSAGLLHAVLGSVGQGSGGATGALAAAGGGAAKGVSASVALKSAAAVTAVTIAGASGAQIGGLVHLPGPGRDSSPDRMQAVRSDEGESGGALFAPGHAAGPDAGRARASLGVGEGASPAGLRGKAGAKDGAAIRPQHGGGESAPAQNPAPGAEPSDDRPLPAAASHGQQTAASHGPESAPGRNRAHSRGAARGAQGSKPAHPTHPSHPAHPAAPPHPPKPSPPPKPPHPASGGSASSGNPPPGSATSNGQRRQGSS